jgi:hypothetical protein
MTHDELLMRLWEKRNALCDNLDIHFALSAVVELHSMEEWGPMEEWGKDEPFSIYICSKCKVPYPCPTIQAIEKELK